MTARTIEPALREAGFRRGAACALAGALTGLVTAIVATFVLALLDGGARGMDPLSCVVYGCALTLLLSQAVGIPAMLAGAGLGALAGAGACALRGRCSRGG